MLSLEELKSVAVENDIKPQLIQMPIRIHGIIYNSWSGQYYVFVNKCISAEKQRETMFHEITHVKNDLCKQGRMISIDNHYDTTEKKADKIARAIIKA